MIRFEDILEQVETYCPDPDEDLLRRAYVFSAREHKGQVRLSGEPYLIHPLNVALNLAKMGLDETSIAVGLLHDVLEDTLTTREALAALFSEEVAKLVDGVTKISLYNFESKEEQQAESFRKMLLASIGDVRVILVKLADRLHNMQTLEHQPPEKRRRIAQETLDIYAPIANRLGMGHLKGELEDLSFRNLHPSEYEEIRAAVDGQTEQAALLIEQVEKSIRTKIAEAELPGFVKGRVKRLYSIWTKLRRRQVDAERIYDYLAFRVVTRTVQDCYSILGIVHQIWRPLPGRFKDYVANPKENGYRSLHTTVVGERGTPFEIQIRTEEMDDLAERGFAAHWKYKEGRPGPEEDDERYRWLRQLVELAADAKSGRQFFEAVKNDLGASAVYACSPKGKVFPLPVDATPVDFAYHVHSEVGNRCVGARVNGRQVPLRTRLETGNVVEILTSPTAQPSRDWLSFVVTARARTKIRHHIQAQQKGRQTELGRRLVDRELERLGSSLRRAIEEGLVERQLAPHGVARPDDLFAEVGSGRLSPRILASRMVPEPAPPEELPAQLGGVIGRVVRKILPFRPSLDAVVVQGTGELMTYVANCCNPVRGEPIVGYITRGKGVAIHAAACSNIRHLADDSSRRVDVDWGLPKGATYPALLSIRGSDRPGLLAKLTRLLAGFKSNILEIDAKVEGSEFVIGLRIEVADAEHLARIVTAIAALPGIDAVDRRTGATRKKSPARKIVSEPEKPRAGAGRVSSAEEGEEPPPSKQKK
jgi:GTP pyrophosphokinase